MKLSFIFILLIIPFKIFALSSWDPTNNPNLMKINYERNFSKLPLTGELTKRPWNANYWPTYQGGISYRWNQPFPEEPERNNQRYFYQTLNTQELTTLNLKYFSPAEKYDLFMGQENWPLTTFEKERTKINFTNPDSIYFDPDFEIPTWEGLCHAWAPAALHFQEPGPVTIKNAQGKTIHFGASDIKALLIYFLQENKNIEQTKTKFLGTRCYLDFKKIEEQLKDGEITQAEFENQINISSCLDTNAGAFHMVLANQIGLLNEGFVADVVRDLEVWNFPLFWFKSKIVEEREGASPGAATFTVKEVRIITIIKHAYSVDQSWYPSTDPTNNVDSYFEDINGKKVYEYTLELDKKGNIIGGKWLSKNRPDFIWKQSIPAFKGYFSPLKDIYEKSVTTLENITKIWKAVTLGDLQAIKNLLKNVDINIQNGEGDTLLHIAIKSNHLKLIRFLINQGADLNITNTIGQSALHLTVGFGKIESTKLLVKAGATLDLRDFSGQTPFHLAVWNQNLELVTYLFKNGADINAQDFNGKAVLHWAALLANQQITEFLIQKMAKIDILDQGGKTPFYWSVLKNNLAIASSLLEANAKVSIKDHAGMAPIHVATFRGFLKMVNLILDNSGDINIKEGSGKSPLHMAVIENNLGMVKLLVTRNAKINIADNSNKTALDYALGNEDILKILRGN